jgi:hypothetical protein
VDNLTKLLARTGEFMADMVKDDRLLTSQWVVEVFKVVVSAPRGTRESGCTSIAGNRGHGVVTL